MANHFMLTCCVLLGAQSAAAASSSALRHSDTENHDGANKELRHHSLLVQAPQAVEQELTICNAYASPHPLSIVRVRDQKTLTEDTPLNYKQCKDFTVPLEEGDQLDFKAGKLDVGTFYATGLPKSSASLLLIPHRRSQHAVGISFESHAFADLKNPQIAVIDAFHSKTQTKNSGSVKIMETVPASQDQAETKVEEDLKYNSVVAVNPGKYEISLSSTNGGGGVATKVPLEATGKAKYVIMRLGVEDDGKGSKYPQELIVFPNNSGATSLARLSFTVILAVAAFLSL